MYGKNRTKEYIIKYNKAKKEFLEHTKNLCGICRKYKMSINAFKNNLRNEGYEIKNLNKRKIKEDIFEIINNEHKAYWLGILYSDGWISNNSNKIELCLKDREHIEKFKNFLGCENKIQTKKVNGKNYYRISFRNKKIRSDLINLGCVPRKSLTKEFPDELSVPQNLIHHFMRGYFDGNGCISICKNKVIIIIDSSIYFINEFMLKFNFPKNKITTKGKGRSIRTAKKDYVFWFLDLLYNNSNIYLERKYKLYKDMIAVYTRNSIND